MLNQFSRTELLLGKEAMERLSRARVAVFGIGGVGGYTVEALVRSGVGAIDLIDDDKVCLTNLNRQIIATRSTVGKYKAEVMRDRILEINPDAQVEVRKCFYLPENADEFDFTEYSYVVDAVDTVTAKLEIIMRAISCEIPVISSMGAGNKLDGGAQVLLSAGDKGRVRFFQLFVCRGCSRYCDGKDCAGHAGAGDRNADHQQHGRRQQAESGNV